MKIAVIGYGRMGKLFDQVVGERFVFVAKESPNHINSLFDIKEKIDIIIDFSNPDNLNMIYDYARKFKAKVVIGTTGYTLEQETKIKELSNYTAVFKSPNFSIGIYIMNQILKNVTPYLKENYDIEMIESHHNKKKDAPSGTAKMFLDTLKDEKSVLKYGRNKNELRSPNEIGVHSIRGGGVIGDHSVLYLGEDDVLKITHQALNAKMFVKGALKASDFLSLKEKGFYTMDDMMNDGRFK